MKCDALNQFANANFFQDATHAPERSGLSSFVHGLAGNVDKGHATLLACERESNFSINLLFLDSNFLTEFTFRFLGVV